MTRIKRSTTIGATPEAIWEYLADPAHWPEWDPDIAEVDASGPGFADGQTWSLRMHQPMRGTVEFANVELHRRLDWNVRALAGLLRSQATFRLEPGEDGTTGFHYEFELGGPVGAILGRLQAATVAKAVDVGLANIAAGTMAGSTGVTGARA